MSENQEYRTLHYACPCLFLQRATALQSGKLAKVVIFDWLGLTQNIKNLKTNAIFGISVKKAAGSIHGEKIATLSAKPVTLLYINV